MTEPASYNQGRASKGSSAVSVAESRSGDSWRGIAVPAVSLLVVVLAIALTASAIRSYCCGGIVSLLLTGGIPAGERVRMVQDYFDSLGVVAPLVYVGIVTVEVVVAPIPGLMLYAPGGVVFGGFLGGLLSLVGNVLGAGISCKLIQVLGGKRFTSWLEQGRLRTYRARLSQSGLWLVLLLRINPLTSSDLVSYAAGLAGIPVWKVMAGTLVGMAPLCWAQAYLCDGILTAVPELIYPLLVLCGIYVVVVAWVVTRMCRRGSAEGD